MFGTCFYTYNKYEYVIINYYNHRTEFGWIELNADEKRRNHSLMACSHGYNVHRTVTFCCACRRPQTYRHRSHLSRFPRTQIFAHRFPKGITTLDPVHKFCTTIRRVYTYCILYLPAHGLAI